MACLLVPAAEAVAVTAITKVVAARESTSLLPSESAEPAKTFSDLVVHGRIPLSQKLRWLSGLLWGGSALLAFEHVWHGEISPFYPFLTAMSSPAEALEMLREMATVGVGMAALVTGAWVAMAVCVERLAVGGEQPAVESVAEREA